MIDQRTWRHTNDSEWEKLMLVRRKKENNGRGRGDREREREYFCFLRKFLFFELENCYIYLCVLL